MARRARSSADLERDRLAGRNAELLKRLQALANEHPDKLFPLGFTTTVERVMTAADLVVTKPGGLSVSECLAKRRPMLLVSPIPGQEERNADYLLESGAAIKAVDGATLVFKLAQLLADPARLQAMSTAAARIGRASAAADVVRLISSSP
jgi:processive 1,2-diacylglycerol beta-glucosyltransferase